MNDSNKRTRNFLEDEVFKKVFEYLKARDPHVPNYFQTQFQRLSIAYSAAQLFDLTSPVTESDRDKNVPKWLRKEAIDALIDLDLIEPTTTWNEKPAYHLKRG